MVKCKKCGEESEQIINGFCPDCFADEWGDIVEKSPMVSPSLLMVKQNWKCRECGTFTLSEAGNYLHQVGEDFIPTSSRVKICTNSDCGRIYDENGNDKFINNKKVYLKAGRILLEGEEETSLVTAMI